MRLLRILLVLGLLAYVVATRLGVIAPNSPSAPPPAAPQAGCVLDNCDAAHPAPSGQAANAPATPPPGNDPAPQSAGFSPAAPGNFDFFLLTLSWSPGFCETNPAGNGKAQCDTGSGLGFVVHGLWPQFERGYPSDCDTRPVTQAALALTRGVFPDPGLARYEWGKHGTCSGLAPEAYFADARNARDSIIVPSAFQTPHDEQSFSPNDIIRAFTDANPRLRPGMVAIGCKGGVLEEVRFCMTKDLRNFRACQEVMQQTCRAGQIRVPPVR